MGARATHGTQVTSS